MRRVRLICVSLQTVQIERGLFARRQRLGQESSACCHCATAPCAVDVMPTGPLGWYVSPPRSFGSPLLRGSVIRIVLQRASVIAAIHTQACSTSMPASQNSATPMAQNLPRNLLRRPSKTWPKSASPTCHESCHEFVHEFLYGSCHGSCHESRRILP